mmetsp:Transcript_41552/g.49815  ORF Transcript_41552/g.49815 Transcript_41552/m.49815 type:complete len:157 (-) Transcript_41552:292-762(-)
MVGDGIPRVKYPCLRVKRDCVDGMKEHMQENTEDGYAGTGRELRSRVFNFFRISWWGIDRDRKQLRCQSHSQNQVSFLARQPLKPTSTITSKVVSLVQEATQFVQKKRDHPLANRSPRCPVSKQTAEYFLCAVFQERRVQASTFGPLGITRRDFDA